VTDLVALAGELLPGASWIGDKGAASARQIAWVRVLRARVPAFDALEPGDLVIAPPPALAVVAPGTAELESLVQALAAVPVSGVLVPEGAGAAASLSSTLRASGLPGLHVPGTDAAALERSVVGFIVARGAELERQAALLEGELRRRALEGAGVAGLVATVSGFLGRALVLEARRGDAIVVHAPAEAPAATAAAAQYQATAGRAGSGANVPRRRSDAERGVALRVALPGGATGERGAAGGRPDRGPGADAEVLVLGSEPVSELARVALPRVAGLLALELARDEAVRGAVDRARRAEPMPSAGPPWVVVLARQREPGPEDDAPAAREGRETLRRKLRILAPARQLSLRGDADSLEVRMVAAAAADGVERDRLIGAIGAVLARPLAVSHPFDSPVDRPAAEAEARATLDAALALPEPPALARSERLAIYRMLGALHKLPDGLALARAVLAPVLDARPDVRRERLATLRALLAYGGVGEAAAALGVHRNTVAYRVRSIEAATGWRLADPELRLALAVAVELVQDAQV
jgi:hypothetical protein